MLLVRTLDESSEIGQGLIVGLDIVQPRVIPFLPVPIHYQRVTILLRLHVVPLIPVEGLLVDRSLDRVASRLPR